MYRLLVESLLGLRVEHGRLHLAPVLRPGWDGYRLSLRHGGSLYRVQVQAGESGEPAQYSMDGVAIESSAVLLDDGREHEMLVRVPAP
jgi:cellobiose phosphorylase